MIGIVGGGQAIITDEQSGYELWTLKRNDTAGHYRLHVYTPTVTSLENSATWRERDVTLSDDVSLDINSRLLVSGGGAHLLLISKMVDRVQCW